MNRATFYIGLGAHAPERMRRLGDMAALDFGGYTLTQGEGGWRNNAGAIVREPCAVLEVYTARGRLACRDFAARVAHEFGEQCVALRFAAGAYVEMVQAPQPAATWECPSCGADMPGREIAQPCAECGAKAPA